MTLVPGGGCRRRRSLARPPLRTSCRAARSLTGHGLVPGHGPGVGAPALKCHNGRSGGTFNPWSRTAQGTGLWVSTLLVLIPAPPHCLGRVKQSPVGKAAGGPRPPPPAPQLLPSGRAPEVTQLGRGTTTATLLRRRFGVCSPRRKPGLPSMPTQQKRILQKQKRRERAKSFPAGR